MGLNELWEFGEMGRKIIIDEFPYLMLLGVLILVGLSTMSLPLIGENYKKKRIHIILETTGIVMVVAAILTLVWRIFTRDI